MIITKSWLNEWIEVADIETSVIAKTLNSIGLEVDRIEEYRVPKKVVFGRVIECEKHPDADKLSVCKVDIGTSVRQIVCGAKNVRAGLDVVVATIGAELPNGMKIKHAVLRGVDSEGMICSAGEIGLVDFGEGIIEVDGSIGKYELGQEVCTHPVFNDDLIEIELTANRGDCLSVRGIARDLCAAFNRPLKDNAAEEFSDKKQGIGRVFSLLHRNDLDVSMLYRAAELKSMTLPMIVQLRLAQVEESFKTKIESLIYYVTHATGVILRGYDYEFFKEEEQSIAKGELKKEEGYVALYAKQRRASIVGVNQCDASKAKDSDTVLILEASYIAPESVSRAMMESKLPSDYVYYRSSRGSEPDLQIGMEYLLKMLRMYADAEVFGGDIEINDEWSEEIVSIKKEEMDAIIGMSVDKTRITNILKNLGFTLQKSSGDTFVLQVPKFRHDIKNKQDIVEEVVRLIGIDNIPSKPIEFVEANRLSDDYFAYKKRQYFRNKAANVGFFEAVHFVFDDSSELKEHGFEVLEDELAILNPIVNTLDTLRPTTMNWLLKSASQNRKNGYNGIHLFELGSVFTPKREEQLCFGFISSGDRERDALANSGKPQKVDFEFFVQKIADVVGDFELKAHTPAHRLAHTYQCAAVYKDGEMIGELFRVHPLVEKELDLDVTFLCEIDFEKLSLDLKQAKNISKFQASFRDLSLLVPKDASYEDIKAVIEEAKSDEVVRFYPVDRYEDEKLGDQVSLTLRFMLRSDEKTLEEEDIVSAMDAILEALKEKMGIGLR